MVSICSPENAFTAEDSTREFEQGDTDGNGNLSPEVSLNELDSFNSVY